MHEKDVGGCDDAPDVKDVLGDFIYDCRDEDMKGFLNELAASFSKDRMFV